MVQEEDGQWRATWQVSFKKGEVGGTNNDREMKREGVERGAGLKTD